MASTPPEKETHTSLFKKKQRIKKDDKPREVGSGEEILYFEPKEKSHVALVKESLRTLVAPRVHEIHKNLVHKRIITTLGVLLLISLINWNIPMKGIAEVSTLYPSTCLGGWNTVHNAEGIPESFNGNDLIKNSNSAILPSGLVSDIYCGDFKGDFPASSTPTHVTLTLFWKTDIYQEEITRIENTNYASSSLQILDATTTVDISIPVGQSSTTEDAQSLDTLTPIQPEQQSPTSGVDPSSGTTETENPQVDIKPAPTPEEPPKAEPVIEAPKETPQPESSPQSLLLDMMKKFVYVISTITYAEETPVENDIVASSSDQAASSTLSTLSDLATTTESVSGVASLPQPNPIIEVLYTLDGKEWTSLGKVEAATFSFNTFDIPIAASSTWEDVSRMQIKVQSLATVDAKPDIFLDGMTLRAEYTENEIEKEKEPDYGDIKRFEVSIGKVYGPFTLARETDIDQGDTIVISSTVSPSSINIFDNTGTSVMYTSLGQTSMPIPAYNLSIGSFSIILTKREDGCATLTLNECKDDEDFKGEGIITITPTSETPGEYVHLQ